MPERKRTATISPCPAGDFILYCDTSALIKLLLEEKYSNKVREFADKCDTIAVCRITWAEAKAALNRHERQQTEKLSSSLSVAKNLITRYSQQIECRDNIHLIVQEVHSLIKEVHQVAHQSLEELWRDCALIDLSNNILNKAGEFSAQFCLKGYDSVQLAAAHEFQLEIGQSSSLLFASFDQQLNNAAAKLKMEIIANF
ncbi:MAG: type II toxin-antitoxin system VapC family toxin [Cyanobacteria bacterium MAG CAR3_bin_5]|nr:type II toxin-antitoxin system VapC family toxin [Cyanobacteria bacterium MAG CAR3_bin_5]